MKNNFLKIILFLFFAFFGVQKMTAQDTTGHEFTTLMLEVRADFNYNHMDTLDEYGFNGRYFNLKMGGRFGKGFSYYFRQRIIADAGSYHFFDNTDFLYLNYELNKNWSFRVGKDALSVGGFEYDAPPIDVIYSSFYWDCFYCFQLGASAAYHSNDGKHTLRAQFSTSPYVHSGSLFKNSLFSYSLMWSARFPHFNLLYSVNMFERERGKFMNFISLGHQVAFDRWDLYLDLIHRATSTSQLLRDFSIVGQANCHFKNGITLFIKGAWEQNFDSEEIESWLATGEIRDCLALPGQRYCYCGIGLEYRPVKQPNIRIHCYVGDFCTADYSWNILHPNIPPHVQHRINANVGLTWNLDFIHLLKNKNIL